MTEPLLTASHLTKTFRGSGGNRVTAVDDVTFSLLPGTCLAIAGESGSGKTTIGRIITGLETADSGEVLVDGAPIPLQPRNRAERLARARAVQMVFQNPFASLDPAQTIEESIMYALELHGRGTRRERFEITSKMLDRVGMGARERVMRPRRLSGGQLQRAAIARALCVQPRVVVLDEAVAALDVSIQAQILTLLEELREELNLSYIFISHDLAVLETISDEAIILKSGAVVERGTAADVFTRPQHEYTQMLIDSIPGPNWKIDI